MNDKSITIYWQFTSFLKPRFALRGNVLDLAIGIIVGTAFTNVVKSLVDDILTPPFALILGGADFINLTWSFANFIYRKEPPIVIRYGRFLDQILYLIVVALVLFFLIKMVNKLHDIAAKARDDIEKAVERELSDELKTLMDIRDLLSKKLSFHHSSPVDKHK